MCVLEICAFCLGQWSPTFLAPGTGFVEDDFYMDGGQGDGSSGNESAGSGSNASDGGMVQVVI